MASKLITSPVTSSVPVLTDVPARLDRLPWSRWHWLVVTALGVTWIIDGLEVTLVGAVSPVLEKPETLHFSATEVGLLNTAYLVGAVIGAINFGYLTDIWGRKRLFSLTVGVYIIATCLTAFAWDFWSFAIFRFFTGAGIGGEYSAINSAIDELIPARLRGRVGLAINGSFWLGAALGSVATIFLLDTAIIPANIGWRVAFAIGGLLGIIIIFLRHWIPESPRWLMIRGRIQEAESIVTDIEQQIVKQKGPLSAVKEKIAIVPHGPITFGTIARVMIVEYPKRTILGLTLIISQAFLYNGVSFTFALILADFYHIPVDRIGIYLLPFAIGNFLGPLFLGRLFDTIGRKPLIASTYAISALLLVLSGYLFQHDMLTPGAQTLLWGAIFFFASAAASSAYLTVSEIFPLELRGMAIALFYAIGTAIGGPAASYLFGKILDQSKQILDVTGAVLQAENRSYLLYGNMFAAGILLVAAAVALKLGIKAERLSLEEITKPLSSVPQA